MKNIKKLFVLFVCISIWFACSEPELFMDEVPTILKSGKIMIEPSTATDVFIKAEEDWQNINDALQNAGPGEVVQLTKGLFYLHKSIVCWNFNGTFKGSGMDKTTIQTAPGITFDVEDCPLMEFSWVTAEGSYMICFQHQQNDDQRTVMVSDLSFIVNEPTTEWLRDINFPNSKSHSLVPIFISYENLNGSGGYWGDQALSDKTELNVLCKNITVTGVEDPVKYPHYGFSVRSGLNAFGASSGSFEAKNICMSNVYYGMVTGFFCGENSTVTLKDFKIQNALGGFYSWVGSSWIIKNNEFKNCSFFGVELGSYNHIYDYSNLGSLIQDNHFIMEDSKPVFNGFRLNNVKLYDNIFSGNSTYGVRVFRGSNWEIKDNDFCNLNVSHPDGWTIRLHYSTNNIVKDNRNQVVGGTSANDPTNFIGEGRDCN